VRQGEKIWHWFEFAIKRQKSSRIMSRTPAQETKSLEAYLSMDATLKKL
jgi:hypothetical protein